LQLNGGVQSPACARPGALAWGLADRRWFCGRGKILPYTATNRFAAVRPFMSLPSSFLSGTAATSGIALFVTLGILGALSGPAIFGLLEARKR